MAVNGKPAKGTWVNRCSPEIGLDPNAVHGAAMPRAIADVARFCMMQHYFEILQPDGTPIGTIMLSGMNSGDPPPGAPSAIGRDNFTVTGGTGAFLGARGQGGNGTAAFTFRITSISEDPANRRINGGGPKRSFIVHVIPMSRPEVVATADGLSVFHPDFSPVVHAKPAKAGEILILRMTGLGPTRSGVDPGQAFPADVLQEVNSPVEATVNGKPAEVLNNVGWPGTVGNYRVDLRIPDGTAAGMASIQVSAAWITGSEVKIPVQ